jgi:hypothetical protein
MTIYKIPVADFPKYASLVPAKHVVVSGPEYENTYDPKVGICVVKNVATSGKEYVNFSDYCHEVAHAVLFVLTGQTHRLSMPEFGMQNPMDSKACQSMRILEVETQVLAIQAVLLQQSGIRFCKSSMYRKECQGFRRLSFGTDRQCHSDFLPIKTKMPVALEQYLAEHKFVKGNPTMEAMHDIWTYRRTKAQLTMLMQMTKKAEATYTKDQIQEALAQLQ